MQRTASTTQLFTQVANYCQAIPPYPEARRVAADYFAGKSEDVAIAKAKAVLGAGRDAMNAPACCLSAPAVQAAVAGVLAAAAR